MNLNVPAFSNSTSSSLMLLRALSTFVENMSRSSWDLSLKAITLYLSSIHIIEDNLKRIELLMP